LKAVGCIDVGGVAVLRWTCWAEIEHWLWINHCYMSAAIWLVLADAESGCNMLPHQGGWVS